MKSPEEKSELGKKKGREKTELKWEREKSKIMGCFKNE